MTSSLSAAIKDRFGFRTPEDFRRLDARGAFALVAPWNESSFTAPGSYLWLPDMEWYSPQDIRSFKFAANHLPGFVPFAFTAGGDYWCWQPEYSNTRGTRVVCCHRDYELATVYAPNFAGAVYRRALAIFDTDDLDRAGILRQWVNQLAGVLPAEWCAHLLALAQQTGRFTTATDHNKVNLAYAEMDTEMRWMLPSRPEEPNQPPEPTSGLAPGHGSP